MILRESFPRQVDKKSRGPQGERGLEFSRRKKGQRFFPSLHSLGLYNINVLCLRTVSGLNLLANSVNYGSRPALYKDSVQLSSVQLLSRVQLFVTLWTVAHQAPPSMGFSRQEYWSGLPFPSPGYLPDPGIEPRSPVLQADALTSEPPGKPKVIVICMVLVVVI